jgi:hypothetical protein
MQRSSLRRALLFASPLALLLALVPAAGAQTWDTATQNPGNPKYHQPNYPVLFVASTGHANEVSQQPPHLGMDVLSASNPSTQGSGGGLYAFLPTGAVKKLFPLAAHEGVANLIDTPSGQLWRGAVVEPNMSEDGRKVYFAYFHDASFEPSGGGYLSWKISYKGADLYRLDLGPLIDDPLVDPATLPVRRLTFKQYEGSPKSNVSQTVADRTRGAVNPTLAQQTAGLNYWGTIDMHLIEMRTRAGLKAVWVSNRARVNNSNDQMGDQNHNFSLFIADFLPDGSLGPPQQWQYYTTTSALSPIPLRQGLAFSYQSSTAEVRRWDIQWIDSEGRWKPLIGYAHSSELFHLGSLAVERDAGGNLVDWFIGQKYYHLNEDSFGTLHRVRLSDAGTNVFQPLYWGVSPRQLSQQLTVGAIDVDAPSPRVIVDGQPVYVGKFASPRAGRVGGEYYMAYTPTSANRWLLDADGRLCQWEAHIAYRPNLQPFRPHDPVDVAQGKGLFTVVRDTTAQYDLFWPTPVLSWLERTGEAQQGVAEPIVDPSSPIPSGQPFAQVGTSALWNTDVRPYDCYLGAGRPFSPNQINSNEEIQIVRAQEGLRYLQDPGDFCGYLLPETVLGIRINITSNRTDFQYLSTPGYETDAAGKSESVETLGVYSVVAENQSDQSFQGVIPSDVPFEFHLLDRRYGMKLVDVRSWHSLKARETRNDCGGCHQHEAGFGIPFAGTEASSKPPFDFVSRTTYVDYDADCKPVLRTAASPTLSTPEWKADVWPGFDQHCGDCHNLTRSSDAAALAALDYDDEQEAYNKLRFRHYAGGELGALGSPAFWAAYGARTDGRNNDLPQYAPNYPAGTWGYRFSSIHASDPGLCAAANPEWASWVRVLGEWIDNHMPRDTGANAYGYKYDRFPPTVEFGLTPSRTHLRVGYWDDRGSVTLEFRLNGARVGTLPAALNGFFVVPWPATLQPSDHVTVIAKDGAGNRQIKGKTVAALLAEPP